MALCDRRRRGVSNLQPGRLQELPEDLPQADGAWGQRRATRGWDTEQSRTCLPPWRWRPSAGRATCQACCNQQAQAASSLPAARSGFRQVREFHQLSASVPGAEGSAPADPSQTSAVRSHTACQQRGSEAQLCPPASPPLTLGVSRLAPSASRMPRLNWDLAQAVGQLEACLPSADGPAGWSRNCSCLGVWPKSRGLVNASQPDLPPGTG